MAEWKIEDGKLQKEGHPPATALESHVAKWVNRRAKDSINVSDRNEAVRLVIHEFINMKPSDPFPVEHLTHHWQTRKFVKKYEADIEDVLYEYGESAGGLEWLVTDENIAFSFNMLYDKIAQSTFGILMRDIASQLFPDED